jgi:hypothetical protein
VSTLGWWCSALGTVLARYSTASRSVVSVMPSSSTIGSSKRFDQPLFAIRFKILSAVAGVRRSCCSEGRACRPRHRCRRAVPAMADRDALHRPIRRRRIASRCVPAWRVPRVRERVRLPSLGSGPSSWWSRLDRDCRNHWLSRPSGNQTSKLPQSDRIGRSSVAA